MTAPTDTGHPPDAAADQARSPFTSVWWVLSAAAVGIIAGLLLWLLLLPPEGGNRTLPRTLENTTELAQPDAGASECGLPDGDQIPPTVTPQDTTWQLVGTMAAPTAPDSVGPGDTVDGVPTCYAPTPLGALYAAANFLAATSTPATRLPAAERLAAPGPGRDAAIADLTCGDTDPDSLCLGGNTSGTQLAGFLFVGYTPATSAAIDLAVATGSGGLAHFPLSLVWTEGDWLVQLPVTGSPYSAAQPLPNLAGYVPFRGA